MMKHGPLAAILLLAAPATHAQTAPGALDQLLIKDACTEQLQTYREGLDQTDPAKIWSVFTPDGVWSADDNLVVSGQAEIRKAWEGIAARRRPSVGVHALSNIRFHVADAQTATGTALVTMYRYNPEARDRISSLAPTMLIQIEMRCVSTPQGWRFDRMSLKSTSVAGYRHGEG